MRRLHVYERSAPRTRLAFTTPAACSAEVARSISRSLPALIDAAMAEGLDALADALEVARAEAEMRVRVQPIPTVA